MKKQTAYSMGLSLRFACEPESGHAVVCKENPERITYGRTFDKALQKPENAFNAAGDANEEQGRELPESIAENHEVES